jgi:peptidoglycan L-alanyl-D-glutamate endopeptidase CwlK|tara:strand:+ start:1140 stop:1532 length:393 start_codon:yes stop_codon:yes gene_type:complete
MPKFGKRSKKRLEGLDSRLIDILDELIKIMDITIIEGLRSAETQNKYYLDNKSKLDGYKKKSNHQTGRAVDLAPYPVDWKNTKRFYYMGGMIRGIAKERNIKIRWGGDWDSDGETKDQTFMDLVHIEVLN